MGLILHLPSWAISELANDASYDFTPVFELISKAG